MQCRVYEKSSLSVTVRREIIFYKSSCLSKRKIAAYTDSEQRLATKTAAHEENFWLSWLVKVQWKLSIIPEALLVWTWRPSPTQLCRLRGCGIQTDHTRSEEIKYVTLPSDHGFVCSYCYLCLHWSKIVNENRLRAQLSTRKGHVSAIIGQERLEGNENVANKKV